MDRGGAASLDLVPMCDVRPTQPNAVSIQSPASPTRTAETEAHYSAVGAALSRWAQTKIGTASVTAPASCAGLHAAPRATGSIAGVIEHGYVPEEAVGVVVGWLLAQHGSWAPSSIRKFRAALIHRCRTLLEAGEGEVEEIKVAIGRLRRERPRPRRGEPRTSARKRKSVPRKEVMAVRRTIIRNDACARVLHSLLFHLPRIGLRPCELQNARLEGDILTVRGAKTTNGRGLQERRLVLSGYKRRELTSLRDMLDALRSLADDPEVDGWDRLHRRLSERLARACKRAGVARISLYTLRHVAIATTKRSQDRVSVAAFAGHCRTRTATQHYGRRRDGWRQPTGVEPDAGDRASVVDNYRPHPSMRSRPDASSGSVPSLAHKRPVPSTASMTSTTAPGAGRKSPNEQGEFHVPRAADFADDAACTPTLRP